MAKLQHIATAIGIVITLLFPLPLLSQSDTLNINGPNDKTEFLIASCASEDVAMLADYLAEIADKSIERRTRLYYKDVALKLFIGEGKKYQEFVLNDDGLVVDTIFCNAVTIGVYSLRSPKLRKRPMADYLLGLAELRYGTVAIESVECHDMRVGEIRKLDEGKYECVIYFDQVIYCKGRDKIPGMINRIPRRVSCEINVVESDEGLKILTLLGNVTATETRKL